MADKRVLKTKKNLKNGMRDLLMQKPFDDITVTELCSNAQTSRITFYVYYSDKYELIDEMFRDMIEVAAEDFHLLQQKNNPDNSDVIMSYENLLDSFLNLYYTNGAFLSRSVNEENPYLHFSCFQYIYKRVEQHFLREKEKIEPRYSIKKVVSFICNGLWGFLNECRNDHTPIEQVRRETKELLRALLRADVLTQEPNTVKK